MFLIILNTPSILNLSKKKMSNVFGLNLDQKHLTFTCDYNWMKY